MCLFVKYIISSLLCYWKFNIASWKLFCSSIWRNLKEHSNISESLRLSHVKRELFHQGVVDLPHSLLWGTQEALSTPKTEELSPSHARAAREDFLLDRDGKETGEGREIREGSCSQYPPTAISKAGREKRHSPFPGCCFCISIYAIFCISICHICNSLDMISFPSSYYDTPHASPISNHLSHD